MRSARTTKNGKPARPQADVDENTTEKFHFKIALVGEPCVGKTSIALRLTQDAFEKSSKQTIGVDFFVKEIALPGNVRVTLQLWDIGGQTLGTKMLGNYIFGSSAILLVYDATLAEGSVKEGQHPPVFQSFFSLTTWLDLMKGCLKEKMPYAAIICNKVDLKEARAVTAAQHNAFVKENDLYSYSMSAKRGLNVMAAFYRIAADLAGVPLRNEHLRTVGGVIQVDPMEKMATSGNSGTESVTEAEKGKSEKDSSDRHEAPESCCACFPQFISKVKGLSVASTAKIIVECKRIWGSFFRCSRNTQVRDSDR